MPKAIDASNGFAPLPSTSRRHALSGLAIAAIGGAATVVAMPPASAAEHPDAELLDLLAQFDALERRIRLTFEPPAETFEAEDAQAALRNPLRERQNPLLERICALRAQTVEGWQARARTLLLWDNEMSAAIAAGPQQAECADDRMIIALIRDMTAGEG